jgi:hypothetical protein
MRRPGRLLAICSALCLLAIPVGAAAQDEAVPQSHPEDHAPARLSEAQERELTTWLKAMANWQRYEAKWHNRPARDAWGRIAARQRPPEAPGWLAAYCDAAAQAALILEARTTTACRLLVDPRAPLESVPTGVQAARIADEQPKHTSFLSRVHLDGLWTTAATTGRFYGLIGSHVTLVDVGRLQIFGPPGVLILSVPDGADSRRITLGYTWGLSYRLTDVRLFTSKDMTLFVNVSRVWLAGAGDGQGSSYTIAGFSLAPNKNR